MRRLAVGCYPSETATTSLMEAFLNIRELTERVAVGTGMSRATARMFVDRVFAEVAAGLVADGEVAIPGFGKMEVREVRAREGTDPSDSSPIVIPAGRKVRFRASKALKERVSL